MQQLNADTYRHFLRKQSDSIVVDTPVPATALKVSQLVASLCAGSGFEQLSPDWGADRYQVTLIKKDMRCLLCIEWLCEAIWLDPIGTTDIETLWQAMHTA